MNEDIVKAIEQNSGKNEEAKTESESTITWLIFGICSKKYAIKSSEVHEIIRDVTVYKLPFLPSYIEGVINRRGDPFTVINPVAVMDPKNEELPEQPLFLILKRDDDQLSLHISDILFFHETDANDLHIIPNGNEEGIFTGTIDYDHEEIPVFNAEAFELLLRKDLGRA